MEEMQKQVEEKPPLLNSWNKIYSLVLAELILLIVLFYFFSKVFS